MTDRPDADEARRWLREHGWDVVVVERDLRREFERTGGRYAPTIDHTHWADLVSIANPEYTVANYGSGTSADDAVIRARRRYGSEQT